jgi:hypothetical protein
VLNKKKVLNDILPPTSQILIKLKRNNHWSCFYLNCYYCFGLVDEIAAKVKTFKLDVLYILMKLYRNDPWLVSIQFPQMVSVCWTIWSPELKLEKNFQWHLLNYAEDLMELNRNDPRIVYNNCSIQMILVCWTRYRSSQKKWYMTFCPQPPDSLW